MKYVEYGSNNKDVIILLHGGGLSFWNYKEVAEKLSYNYHIIIPILDGHSGSEKDFTTIKNNALEIIDFIEENYKKVLLIGGLSLGGQILLEMLSNRNDICEYAIIESALCIPSKFTCFMIKPTFGSCYGLIKKRWFAKLQFKSLKIKEDLFEDYYKDTCAITKKNMIAFLQDNSLYSLKDNLKNCNSKVKIFVGSKENKTMKKSAKMINEYIKNSSLEILSDLYHGELSLNYSDLYIEKLLQLLRGKKS